MRALTFEYHGIAERELEAAKELAAAARVEEHRRIRLPDLKESGDIRKTGFDGLPGTYIPGRNGIFYSFAASYAEEVGATVIVGGHNQDDRDTFRDARPLFFSRLEAALKTGSSRARIELPLSRMTKVEVVRRAVEIGVPLRRTWSCHRDGRLHCWRCEGCLARTRVFREAGVVDPLGGKRRGKLLKG